MKIRIIFTDSDFKLDDLGKCFFGFYDFSVTFLILHKIYSVFKCWFKIKTLWNISVQKSFHASSRSDAEILIVIVMVTVVKIDWDWPKSWNHKDRLNALHLTKTLERMVRFKCPISYDPHKWYSSRDITNHHRFICTRHLYKNIIMYMKIWMLVRNENSYH